MKIIIRNLPPNPPPSILSIVLSDTHPYSCISSKSSSFITLVLPDSLLQSYYSQFNSCVLLHNNSHYQISIQIAPFQKIPKPNKPHPNNNTILNDPDYLSFLQSLHSSFTQSPPSPTPPLHSSTPLLDDLRAKKKFRDDKKAAMLKEIKDSKKILDSRPSTTPKKKKSRKKIQDKYTNRLDSEMPLHSSTSNNIQDSIRIDKSNHRIHGVSIDVSGPRRVIQRVDLEQNHKDSQQIHSQDSLKIQDSQSTFAPKPSVKPMKNTGKSHYIKVENDSNSVNGGLGHIQGSISNLSKPGIPDPSLYLDPTNNHGKSSGRNHKNEQSKKKYPSNQQQPQQPPFRPNMTAFSQQKASKQEQNPLVNVPLQPTKHNDEHFTDIFENERQAQNMHKQVYPKSDQNRKNNAFKKQARDVAVYPPYQSYPQPMYPNTNPIMYPGFPQSQALNQYPYPNMFQNEYKEENSMGYLTGRMQTLNNDQGIRNEYFEVSGSGYQSISGYVQEEYVKGMYEGTDYSAMSSGMSRGRGRGRGRGRRGI